MKYVFGEYKNKDFCFKKVNESWICENNNTFRALKFPARFAAKKIKDTLSENFAGVSFYKLNLREAHSERELKDLLKSKLGCLADNSKVEVTELFKADSQGNIQDLTDDILKKLQDIAEGKEKFRTLNTGLLSKAWKTVRGTNANIRNLNTKQGAYLFAYLSDGTILESGSDGKILQYQVDLQSISATDIQERFEKAVKMAKDSQEVINEFKFNKAKYNGQGVIVCFGRKSSISDLNKLQEIFRKAFTEEPKEPPKTAGEKIKKTFKKAINTLKGLFKDGKAVKLEDYKIQQTDIQMSYSQEEIDLAKEILLLQDRKLPKDDAKEDKKDEKPEEKPEEPVKDKSEDKPKDDKPKEEKPVKDKKFDDTALGRRLRRSVYKKDGQEATNPEGLKKAREAGKAIKQNWSQENAETLLRASADAIQHSSWRDPKKLGDTLRQVGLIEDLDLTPGDKSFINTIVTGICKKYPSLAEDEFGEIIDAEIARYCDDALDLQEISEDELNAFTSNLTNYAFELFDQKSKSVNEEVLNETSNEEGIYGEEISRISLQSLVKQITKQQSVNFNFYVGGPFELKCFAELCEDSLNDRGLRLPIYYVELTDNDCDEIGMSFDLKDAMTELFEKIGFPISELRDYDNRGLNTIWISREELTRLREMANGQQMMFENRK